MLIFAVFLIHHNRPKIRKFYLYGYQFNIVFAAMLDFVTTSEPIVFSNNTSWKLTCDQIRRETVKRLKSYSNIKLFKMAAAAILDFC